MYNIYCRVYCSPTLMPILSHINPIGSCTPQDGELMSYTPLLHYGSLLPQERLMCNLKKSLYSEVKIYFTFYVTAISTMKKVQNCVTAYRHPRSVLIRELRVVSAT
jgi:hypothetical protein